MINEQSLLKNKKFIVIAIVVGLLVTAGLVAAVTYSYQPSNDLTIKETAPVVTPSPSPSPTSPPTIISTVLTADKTDSFKSGETLDLIATLSQPLAGVNVAFQEVLTGGVLGAPGYATTNAQGVATFHFTPSPVDVDTNRVFRATPIG